MPISGKQSSIIFIWKQQETQRIIITFNNQIKIARNIIIETKEIILKKRVFLNREQETISNYRSIWWTAWPINGIGFRLHALIENEDYEWAGTKGKSKETVNKGSLEKR